MSFILDALRKSEIERKRQSGPSVAEFPVAREDRRLPVALIAICVLLTVNVAVVLYFVMRDARAPATEATQAAGSGTASTSSAAPPATVTGPGLGPANAGPGALASEMPLPDEFAGQPAEMYGEIATLPPDAPDPTLLPDTPVSSPGVVYGETPPEDALAAQAATGLPELSVDLHIFSDDPSKRAVFINGRRYTQGAQIAEGPRVEEITREGAMLSWRGRRFLLPRL
jgi:general secretion pathway protein B